MSSESTSALPPYRIRTAELPATALEHRAHHIVAANQRYQLSLGDSTGLTSTGVHLCRLAAGATSTTLHYHAHDDEWVYVLDAGGDGAVLLVWEGDPSVGGGSGGEEGAIVPREEALRTGDFLGFKAGVPRAHALRAGPAGDVVYLLGGSRLPVDVCYYPAQGKRMVTESTAPGAVAWTVRDEDAKRTARKAYPTVGR